MKHLFTKAAQISFGMLAFATAAIAQTPVSPPSIWPLSITASGSYQLTANMLAPATSSAIVISASNVTLDLNGFTVSQAGLAPLCNPNTTLGYGSTCGGGTGPTLIVGTGRNITIKNGIVTNGTGSGIDLNFSPITGENGAVFEDLRVTGNRGDGITAYGKGSRFNRVDVSYNSGYGIDATESIFSEVSANWNNDSGIKAAGERARGIHVTARANGQYGILGAGQFEHVVVADNQQAGLNVAGILKNIRAIDNGWNDIAGLVMDSWFSSVNIVSGCYSQLRAGTLTGAGVPMTTNTCP